MDAHNNLLIDSMNFLLINSLVIEFNSLSNLSLLLVFNSLVFNCVPLTAYPLTTSPFGVYGSSYIS